MTEQNEAIAYVDRLDQCWRGQEKPIHVGALRVRTTDDVLLAQAVRYAEQLGWTVAGSMTTSELRAYSQLNITANKEACNVR